MEIKILGSTGCHECRKLVAAVRKAAGEMGLEASISEETDMKKIMEYDVLSLPALVVDGKVLCSGRAPCVSEVKGMLR